MYYYYYYYYLAFEHLMLDRTEKTWRDTIVFKKKYFEPIGTVLPIIGVWM